MAPKRGVKRGPEEQKVAALLKKLQVTQGSFKQISEALSHPSAELNEECRAMLLAGLPFSLCVFQDQRDDVQELVVNMYDQAMSKILGGFQVALDKENEQVAGAEGRQEEQEKLIEAASGGLESAKALVAARGEALQAASEEVVKAKGTVAQRLAEQFEGDGEYRRLLADKALLEMAHNESFKVLKVQGGESTFKQFEPALQLLAMDQSLKTTVPGVLSRSPSERGSFDGTVIEELEKTLLAKIEELNAAAEALKPAAEERQGAVEAAQKELEAFEGKQQKASEELCAAKEAQKASSAAVAEAKEAAKATATAHAGATGARDAAKAELEAFVDGPLATFQELKVRCKKRKIEEAPEPEAVVEAP